MAVATCGAPGDRALPLELISCAINFVALFRESRLKKRRVCAWCAACSLTGTKHQSDFSTLEMSVV
jgi:hypothetical protein